MTKEEAQKIAGQWDDPYKIAEFKNGFMIKLLESQKIITREETIKECADSIPSIVKKIVNKSGGMTFKLYECDEDLKTELLQLYK